MKTKLTLSIDSAKVRRAKIYGRERGKSVSELVEEMIDKLTVDAKSAKSWSQRWGGTLRLTAADMKRDDRFGKLVRRAAAAPRARKKQRA
ncbi:MAG: hypothetical protein JST41_12535 [Bacteroidetes bacterium]|jgi:hypothetical protein|nr:hypothetical protein [Bacteroidota bacterium]HMU13166.1 DUF6364 family protein [Flavobacteriales bacterium]